LCATPDLRDFAFRTIASRPPLELPQFDGILLPIAVMEP
jgi:hypothetical protein